MEERFGTRTVDDLFQYNDTVNLQLSSDTLCGRFRWHMVDECVSRNGDTTSFEYWLWHLPLKPAGYRAHYVDGGGVVEPKKCCAVIDLPVCRNTDAFGAVLRIRAEYLHDVGRLQDLSFRLKDRRQVCYLDWLKGDRFTLEGKPESVASVPDSRWAFHQFLDAVIACSGQNTLLALLEPELDSISATAHCPCSMPHSRH